jgi:hypothetical protein
VPFGDPRVQAQVGALCATLLAATGIANKSLRALDDRTARHAVPLQDDRTAADITVDGPAAAVKVRLRRRRCPVMNCAPANVPRAGPWEPWSATSGGRPAWRARPSK